MLVTVMVVVQKSRRDGDENGIVKIVVVILVLSL